MLGFVPLRNLKRVYAALKQIGLEYSGAGEISDVVTCPGAYSCNLALTKTMNLGIALSETVATYTDTRVKNLSIRASGCPNACGQHWIGDIGFYGNARKIDGKEVPYYLMLLGGGSDRNGDDAFRPGRAEPSGEAHAGCDSASVGSLYCEPHG